VLVEQLLGGHTQGLLQHSFERRPARRDDALRPPGGQRPTQLHRHEEHHERGHRRHDGEHTEHGGPGLADRQEAHRGQHRRDS
jgi:hypothetical protein